MLRALYILLYNGEESIIPLSVELFHVIGEILEGIPAEELELIRVNKAAFLEELQAL